MAELNLAETRRFELLKDLTPYLVSSEAHSTGLCDVSELQGKFTDFFRWFYPFYSRRSCPPLPQFWPMGRDQGGYI